MRTSSSWICHAPDIPGKFDAKKAMELGLPKGPKYGLLQQGKSVHTDSGKTILPSDVISPAIPGAIFMVLECPTVEHARIFHQHVVFTDYMAGNKYAKELTFMVHITPSHVMKTQEYKSWMAKFSEKTEVRESGQIILW